MVPASTRRPAPAAAGPGAVVGTARSRRGWQGRAGLRALLSVLKSFFVFLQMLGSLGQRFSICQRLPEQVTLALYLYRTSLHAELTAVKSRRLGRFQHFLVLFCCNTERCGWWESGAVVLFCSSRCDSSESLAGFEERLKAELKGSAGAEMGG